MARWFSIFLAAALLLLPAAKISAIDVPYLSGPVVDDAGLLNASEKQEIGNLIRSLHDRGVLQMTILITPSLQGSDIESYSIAVADKWKLGKKKEDKGLILIVAPNERRMRLEVGYGLEGEITDAFSKGVLDEILKPHFRSQRYGEGIRSAVLAVAQKLGANLGEPVVVQPRRQNRKTISTFLTVLLFLFFILMSILGGWGGGPGRRYRGGGWGGGGWSGGGGGWSGGGGGGWSGGGGGFGGGGASGSW